MIYFIPHLLPKCSYNRTYVGRADISYGKNYRDVSNYASSNNGQDNSICQSEFKTRGFSK